MVLHSVIDESIKQLVADYQQNPHRYFSECELQYDLYCIFKASKIINESATTTDGIDVGTIHPEYPSVDRVQLQDGKGYRVWFDIAILNADFISSNSYKTVWARGERDTLHGTDNVAAAFELKYFPVKRTHDFSSVQQDCLKLSLCKEVVNKYVLVFSSYEIDELTLASINTGSSSLYWITPHKIHVMEPKLDNLA